jgi:ribosomal protein S18 acetylase RimI-like enzyme
MCLSPVWHPSCVSAPVRSAIVDCSSMCCLPSRRRRCCPAQVTGADPTYAHVLVVPWIATIPDDPRLCPLATDILNTPASEGGLDPSAKLPAATGLAVLSRQADRNWADNGVSASASTAHGPSGRAALLQPDPPQDAAMASCSRLVVATLDVNRGRNLPAEELIGRLPRSEGSTIDGLAWDGGNAGGGLTAGAASSAVDPDAANKSSQQGARAYLSNVCVAKAARRRGLAQRLILAACAVAGEAGVTHMYVHVVHDNVPALQLYTQVSTGLLGGSCLSANVGGLAF